MTLWRACGRTMLPTRPLLLVVVLGLQGAPRARAQEAQQPAVAAPPIETQKPANAAAAAAAAPAARPGAPPTSLGQWASTVSYGAQIDAGIAGNPQDPGNGENFGQLITDKANRPILNQLLLTVERDTDPKATGYDFGFKLQGRYGSDARVLHELGVFDHAIHDRNQIDIVEANVSMHAPWLFGGGIDLKAGIYPSPLGFEVIDPKANPFYSHSFISNYGLPFKHLGVLGTSHVTPVLDLYLGIDSGTNTTVGSGDNNGRPAGIIGFGVNVWSGALTVLALSHMGPEDATLNTSFGNDAMRYYNDVVVTYKQSDRLSFTTELDYVRETGFRAEAYGVSQYVSRTLADAFTLNVRAEVFRDNNNFFVSNPVNNLDYTNSERGLPANFYTASRPTTYSEFTTGVTWKPVNLPPPVRLLMVRPEIRYNRVLDGSRAFDDGRNRGSFTLAADVILGF